MSSNGPNFELPKNIVSYLAALSRLYAKENKTLLQTLVVNSKIRVHEAWDSL